MNRILSFFFVLLPLFCLSQTRDYSNWINFGSSHSSKWLQIAPAKLGPNALPVPEIDWAQLGEFSKVETGAHFHHMPGDTAINSYFSFFWNIAPGRAAVKIWGQPTETFRLSNILRDDRQIYYDDTGWITQGGDLFISTYVQLFNERKHIPSFSINYTLKTTTGGNIHGRYTDASMNYFYLAAGKSLQFKDGFIDEIRLAGLLGFYVWQTNKVEMAQDEGPVFVGGLKIRKNSFSIQADVGGYTGYDAYEFMDRYNGEDRIQGNNDPLVLRTKIENEGKHFCVSVEYQTGFRDYHYQTFRLNIAYRFNPVYSNE
ncbi:MAG: hypothetical protein JW798_17195 [Prolixibacteraceae bacterium]|nr:hypothetical protein [Prolixibacteraceae bacterium]